MLPNPVTRSLLCTGALVALLLVACTFPDVIFFGASIRISDQLNGAWKGLQTTTPFPVSPHTEWWSGANDTGGAAFQSEPMAQFIKSAIWNGDSPYWNPFSGGGALGPESLVDLKLSLFTIAHALLGGGSLAYNIIFLGSYFMGIVCVYASTRRFFGMSLLASVGTCIFFLLNGYATASLGSNVSLSYPFAALLLFAALSIVTLQTVGTVALFSIALAAMMSFTFLPTTITAILCVCVISTAQFISERRTATAPAGNLAKGAALSIVVGSLVAVLIVAPIYLPLLENLKVAGTLDEYSKRVFYPLFFPNALPSIFSPSLFFESYNAMEKRALAYYSGELPRSFPGNTVYHMGTIGILLAASSFSKTKRSAEPVVRACIGLVIVTMVRLFDPPLLSTAVSRIPVLGNIAEQYWWPCIALPLSLLVGFGLDNIREDRARLFPTIAIVTAGILVTVYVWFIFGLREPHLTYKREMLLAVGGLAVSFVVLMIVARLSACRWKRDAVAVLLNLLMFCEFAVDAKVVRFPRSDLYGDPPAALQFVKEHVGLYRTLNFGQTGLYPELGSAFGIQNQIPLMRELCPHIAISFFRQSI